jgi:hypothetical protein
MLSKAGCRTSCGAPRRRFSTERSRSDRRGGLKKLASTRVCSRRSSRRPRRWASSPEPADVGAEVGMLGAAHGPSGMERPIRASESCAERGPPLGVLERKVGPVCRCLFTSGISSFGRSRVPTPPIANSETLEAVGFRGDSRISCREGGGERRVHAYGRMFRHGGRAGGRRLASDVGGTGTGQRWAVVEHGRIWRVAPSQT